MSDVRLAVDIGGTFTDVVLEHDGHTTTTKVLTTSAPEDGVLVGVRQVLDRAGVDPQRIGLFVHGTTLATNALIERKGAVTALLTTDGFRDSVEMAHENRFEQYDIFMDRPEPLVPRHRRLDIPERMAATGEVLLDLDEDAVRAVVPTLVSENVTSVAVGYLHSFVNSAHEERTREILAEELPGVAVSLSSETAPEIREYERMSTTCANAYIQPLMATYLQQLERSLRDLGLTAPMLLMLSSGGLCTLDTAVRRPIGLVESGPAGGAVLAGHLARQCGLGDVVSFDMGGTTAKLCLIEDGLPHTSRDFEVARVYRFLKGSGLPLRIPVIEMVEIGAGGGSIARVDDLRRITVGPDSASSIPGPACYGQGGTSPTVTDADLALGRIEPTGFAAGELPLDPKAAGEALDQGVGGPLGLTTELAAFGVSEMVEENMAGAARVHAVELGRDISRTSMVAFGGAAPLHATRLADRLGIDSILVPVGAGVGSAIGFLRAPVSYEVVRTRYQRLNELDLVMVADLLGSMADEASKVVNDAAPDLPTTVRRVADMRYRGQGHEIVVPLPAETPSRWDTTVLRERFEAEYRQLFGRTIPGLEIEILSWSLVLATVQEPPDLVTTPTAELVDGSVGRPLFDTGLGEWVQAAQLQRSDLDPGSRVMGPALVIEDQTTTVIGSGWQATVDAAGNLRLDRQERNQR